MRSWRCGFVILASTGLALLVATPCFAQTRADSLAVARAVADNFLEGYVRAGLTPPTRHVFPSKYYFTGPRHADSLASWPGLRASLPPERIQAGESSPDCSAS